MVKKFLQKIASKFRGKGGPPSDAATPAKASPPISGGSMPTENPVTRDPLEGTWSPGSGGSRASSRTDSSQRSPRSSEDGRRGGNQEGRHGQPNTRVSTRDDGYHRGRSPRRRDADQPGSVQGGNERPVRAPRHEKASSDPSTTTSSEANQDPTTAGEAHTRRRRRGGRGRRENRSDTPQNMGDTQQPADAGSMVVDGPNSTSTESPTAPRTDRPPRRERDGERGRGRRRDERSGSSDRPERRPRPPREESEGALASELNVPSMEGWSPAEIVVEPREGTSRFADLDLPNELQRAVWDMGFKYCTPIQAGILPHIIGGRDGLGKAQTGTGKTAAFLLTLYSRLLRHPSDPEQRAPGTPRALILAPTRELVMQIEEEARLVGKYAPLRSLAVFGGIDYEKQRRVLHQYPVDIVAATPGRLLDFRRSRDIDLSKVEVLVIDEADRMLDMGFIPDVRTIVRSLPALEKRQTLFFSATFNKDVEELANMWTHDPARVEIEPETVAAETVDQAVYICTDDEKLAMVYHILLHEQPERMLIFVNRRDAADRLQAELTSHEIECAILSGSIPQGKRMKTLERFKAGEIRVVVATDVAGRGIHVDGISHVINYNLPNDPEDYVHRIGRTGRAGAEGKSVSFASQEDSFYIPDIETFLGKELICRQPDPAWLVLPEPGRPIQLPERRRTGGGGGRSGGGRGGPRRPSGNRGRGGSGSRPR